jgi:hypothetical protein
MPDAKRLSESRLRDVREAFKLLNPDTMGAELLRDRDALAAEFEQYKQDACKTAFSAGNLTLKLETAVRALREAQEVVMEFATQMLRPTDEELHAMMKKIGQGVTRALKEIEPEEDADA